MKKILYIVPALILFLLVGCGPKIKLPDNPVVFETKDNDGYMSIICGDNEYIPFCPFDPSQVGDCIGYYENNGDKIYDNMFQIM